MTVKEEGCEIFNNLAEDEDLFKSEGDYQFDVYRYVVHDGEGEGLEIRGIFSPKVRITNRKKGENSVTLLFPEP